MESKARFFLFVAHLFLELFWVESILQAFFLPANKHRGNLRVTPQEIRPHEGSFCRGFPNLNYPFKHLDLTQFVSPQGHKARV